jgi:oligopeptide/dipeptide ABC transporter ATP-binding protein
MAEMLNLVSLSPENILDRYPHELSGGMCQRVMIATALSCDPALLIADEPTTALDVTIEAQILALLKELKRKIGISLILITHNLNIVAETCTKMAVMYAGNIIERGEISEIFSNPLHPYTSLLLKSAPKIDKKQEKLSVIKGSVPNLIHPPPGCRFHPRCPRKMDICTKEKPPECTVGENHKVSCFLYGGT